MILLWERLSLVFLSGSHWFSTHSARSLQLDGENIRDLNIQDYRKHLALVSQEPTLYAGTIRFNILLGATKDTSEVTQEELEDACRDANVLEFIQSLPQYVKKLRHPYPY